MAKYRKFSEEEDRQFWRNNYIIEASYFVQSLEAGKKKKLVQRMSMQIKTELTRAIGRVGEDSPEKLGAIAMKTLMFCAVNIKSFEGIFKWSGHY